MSNDHIAEPLRSVLNRIANDHRTAHEELSDGMAALKRAADMQPEPDATKAITRSDPMKIILEKCPDNRPRLRWVAYYEGREDDLMTAGETPVIALANFLSELGRGRCEQRLGLK